MAMKFCVVSGKGGTGKSTVSFGLAAAFSALGKNVLLVDLDEGLRCLDTLLGVNHAVVNDLSDLFEGDPVENALYNSEFYENLSLVPAPDSIGVINYANLLDFDKRLGDSFDVVIYDFPAGIDRDKLGALSGTAQFLVVSNMDGISLKDAAAIRMSLSKTQKEPRLIINRFYSDYIKDGIWDNIDSMIDKSGVRLLGIIPASFECATLSITHKFNKKGRAFSAFKRIAKRLCGEDVLLPKISKI